MGSNSQKLGYSIPINHKPVSHKTRARAILLKTKTRFIILLFMSVYFPYLKQPLGAGDYALAIQSGELGCILIDLFAQPLGNKFSRQAVAILVPVASAKIAPKPEGILETM